MKSTLLSFMLLVVLHFANAQVKTNFNNPEVVTSRGKFMKDFRAKNPYIIPARDIKALLKKDALENASGEAKPFRIAEAISVDIDVVQEAVWVEDGGYAHGKFTIVAAGAKSISANFDQFNLPKGTELYVYSEHGEMITGPVTENENNGNNFWGSWVYKGGLLTVDFKTPIEGKPDLKLHISNVAYGYKSIYQSKVNNFGESGDCNVNVLCVPDGNGWQNEMNSVALILDASSIRLCSGALINNTCNLNIPFLLTANHCFATVPEQNVANWKFTFQAWSATCPDPGVNADGITFNGSTLRARNADSDFCLVELSQMPPANSGITFSGWSRAINAATSGVGIHHPAGDVMKISTYILPLIRADNPILGTVDPVGNLQWVVQWNLNQGVTEGGSSGSPLFDQDHRIVGQLGGGPSVCGGLDLRDAYGRFDNSWTGGGTNTTRLSNWLDPGNTGVLTTNARIIQPNPSITGPSLVCTTATFTLNNPPPGVTWSISPSNLVTPSVGTGSVASITKVSNGNAVITFNWGCAASNISLNFHTGPYSSSDYPISGPSSASCGSNVYYSTPTLSGATSINWIWPSGWTYVSGQGTTNLALKARSSGIVGVGVNNTCGPSGSYATKYVTVFGTCTSSATLSVYPNPASSTLTISFVDTTATDLKTNTNQDFEFAYEVKIYNQYQELIYATQTNRKMYTIPTANFPNGAYFLNILNQEGIIQRKIFINKN